MTDSWRLRQSRKVRFMPTEEYPEYEETHADALTECFNFGTGMLTVKHGCPAVET
ncbi:hypothetical protein AB3S75_005901 [Citrus x aurantiifolia]